MAHGGRRFPLAPTRPSACRARLTGLSPPSGRRQKTQSAQCEPIDSAAAMTPSPHHCQLCVCGQCAASSGRIDGFRRMSTTHALVLPELAPEGAARAIGRPGRLVNSSPPPSHERAHSARYGAKPGFASGSSGADQPPPSASIRPIVGHQLACVQRDLQALRFQRGALRGDDVEIRRRAVAIEGQRQFGCLARRHRGGRYLPHIPRQASAKTTARPGLPGGRARPSRDNSPPLG